MNFSNIFVIVALLSVMIGLTHGKKKKQDKKVEGCSNDLECGQIRGDTPFSLLALCRGRENKIKKCCIV